jgi:methyltransferase (TIGR00027 family)
MDCLPEWNTKLAAVVRAIDATWYRRLTALELVTLQGLVDPSKAILPSRLHLRPSDNRFESSFVTNRASLTAEYMALFRALESSRPSSSRLFLDSDAALFLTSWRTWLYRTASLPVGRRIVEALLDRAAPGARAAGIARTKWIDDEATGAFETATQMVLLGAGFDMRGLRLPAAARADCFELDHPETSLCKQAILKRAQRTLPGRVRYIGIDFNCQSIAEVLLRGGFDNSRPSCWIWEGVTNYLTAEAVDSVLRQIRETAKGNTLIFTYIDRAVLDHPERFLGAAKLIGRLRSYAEPWTFGLHRAELRTYLATRGFELLKDVAVAEVWQRAGRSGQGTRGYDFYRLASARVVG